MHAIRNPDHRQRVHNQQPCEQCGRMFRPWVTSAAKRFCSYECAGANWHQVTMAARNARRAPVDPELTAAVIAECEEAYAAFKAAVEARA